MLPDNYDLWVRHNDALEEQLAKRPICDECGHHIQDDYFYNIENKRVCEDCLNNYYKEYVDD